MLSFNDHSGAGRFQSHPSACRGVRLDNISADAIWKSWSAQAAKVAAYGCRGGNSSPEASRRNMWLHAHVANGPCGSTVLSVNFSSVSHENRLTPIGPSEPSLIGASWVNEAPRVSRRLLLVRRRSHDEQDDEQVFT